MHDNISANLFIIIATDVEDLRGRILQAWDELDQRIIDKAVGEWHTRLCLCVNSAGGQFEYKL